MVRRKQSSTRAGVHASTLYEASSTNLSTKIYSLASVIHRKKMETPTPQHLSPTTLYRAPTSPVERKSNYPATFIHADSLSFKQVVQMLTSSIVQTPGRSQVPAAEPKLYERRNSLKSFNISLNCWAESDTSSSVVESPSPSFSPVTPLIGDPFWCGLDFEAEEKTIREKGFYLHPSPVGLNSPAGSVPQLLSLFPGA